MIEPMIGHMKNEGRLARNFLKGIIGDQLNALLCGIGHNLRMLLRFLTPFFNLLGDSLREIIDQVPAGERDLVGKR